MMRMLLLRALLLAAPACAVSPAPTVEIAPGVMLPYVAMGTGSGQHGNVSNATALWLGSSAGVAIDTSIIYKDEPAIASGIAAIGAARASFFLETKVVTKDFMRFDGHASVAAEIAYNLEALGSTPYVDLLLLHFPGSETANAEAWAALEAALAANQTRSIGVSNFNASQLAALKKTAKVWPPAVNQLELSISYHDDDALAYNKAEGIHVQAYSPLCGGFAGSSCTAHGGKNVLTVPEVIAAAKTYGVSGAQIGLKWVVQRGFPLATSIWKLEYMDEDLSLWGFTITDADMKVLDAVYRPAHGKSPTY